MKKLSTLLLFLVWVSIYTSAQDSVTGLWKGALMKSGNSVQLLEVTFSNTDSLIANIEIPDLVYYDAQQNRVDKTGEVVRFNTLYGEAKLMYDTIFQEMIGTVGDYVPPINIHLKRMVPDRKLPLKRQGVEFSNKGLNFGGDLYMPELAGKLPCIIMVSGRGCNPKGATEELARFFARQGIASVAFDERGSKANEFDCNLCTQELETEDLVAVIEALKKNKNIESDKIGVFTTSAGAWTADAASLETELAFMIQYVGPATSIKEQQFDGLRAFAKSGAFDLKYLKDAERYTELLFTENPSDDQFDELEALLEKAKSDGWIEWLDDSDIPESKAKFGELWVQRYQFDPAVALKNYKGPFLSILGEKDDIVPYNIQFDRMDSLFLLQKKSNYEKRLVYEGGHGLNQGFKVRSLPYSEELASSPSYYKYYRAGVIPLIHAVDFLKKYQFIVD